MKPYVALKLDTDARLTAAMIEAVRDQWIAEYQKLEREDPSLAQRCQMLIRRAQRACELAVGRYSTDRKRSTSSGCYDDSYYDWVEQQTAAEEAELDGDFPLGNAPDADFATPYFTLSQIARIQCGDCYAVPLGYLLEPSGAVRIRRGFLAELRGQWQEAEKWYRRAGEQQRQALCGQKKTHEGIRCLEQARHSMAGGQWIEVPALLSRAVQMENADAMVDMALAHAAGTMYFQKQPEKACELLQKAAREYHSIRAMLELVRLHDGGSPEVSARAAQSWCEQAAQLGDEQAQARLEKGFDLRPVEEILQEQVEKGDVDALWRMRQHCLRSYNRTDAQDWQQRALEAGQVDALLQEADMCLWKNSDFYNRELGERHLRRAAGKGSVPAILRLGELALEEGDVPFWEWTGQKQAADAALRQRHQRQLAWHKLAAEAGAAESMNRLCVAYMSGYPVEADGKQALVWAQRAAQAGSAVGMYHLAVLLEAGMGAPRDLDMALDLYTRAAEAGVTDAMLRLYAIYKDGLEHIPARKEKASRYLWMSGTGHS